MRNGQGNFSSSCPLKMRHVPSKSGTIRSHN